MHRTRSARTTALVVLAAFTLLLVACGPESERTRGGGPGADIGNHGRTVSLHGDGVMFHETPLVGNAIRK